MPPKKKSKPTGKKPSEKRSKPTKPMALKKKAPKVAEKGESRGFTLSLRGDRSLQAYKDMVLGMMSAIKPGYKDTYTEEEWVEKWKEFWAASDNAKVKRQRGEVTPEPERKYKTAEEQYPGITEQIRQFEEMVLPACPHCGSADTASVQVGVIGRTMYIAGKTKKFKLVMNMSNKLGKYFCNQCKKYFDE